MSVTFEQLLAQAKVELDSKGLYLAKEHRTCEAMARVFVAVRAMIDTTMQQDVKAESEKTKLATANSKLAAELAEAQKELNRVSMTCVKRTLENDPAISEATRHRALSVNGN